MKSHAPLADIRYVPADIAPRISRYTVRKSDLFITVAGTLGVVGEIPVELDGANLTENADKLTNIRIDKRYLLACLRSPLIQRRIEAERTQNAQPKLAIERICNFPIFIPPSFEQRAIADRLSRWDRAISLTERLIAAKLKLRKGLMQQLLTGKRRFPGFSEPWEKIHLGQVTTESKERNRNRFGRESVRAVTNSAGMIPMREQTMAKNLDRYKTVEPRGFAYNPMRINVGSLCMWHGEHPALVSPDYVVFTCNANQLDPDYFNYLRETHRWNYYMQAAENGSVRVRIYYDDLAALRFVLPAIEEQRYISGFFRMLDRELSLLQAQLDAIKTQKRGLMQQLLTGKRRVPVPESEPSTNTRPKTNQAEIQ